MSERLTVLTDAVIDASLVIIPAVAAGLFAFSAGGHEGRAEVLEATNPPAAHQERDQRNIHSLAAGALGAFAAGQAVRISVTRRRPSNNF